jgi:hypothetical protein
MTRHVPVVATVTLIVATPITHYLGGLKLYSQSFKLYVHVYSSSPTPLQVNFSQAFNFSCVFFFFMLLIPFRDFNLTRFMPFMGGRQFVLLQALGWTFYSVCVMMSILITTNRDEFSVYAGLYTSIGFFGFISQVTFFTFSIFFLLKMNYFQFHDFALHKNNNRIYVSQSNK